ncbi:hypothetical protein [Streptomyces sp. I05A-00742]|nr:hypothetical protein [Streptomyces sp. I05A-00742]
MTGTTTGSPRTARGTVTYAVRMIDRPPAGAPPRAHALPHARTAP